MSRKLVYLGCLALTLCVGATVRAAVFSDSFGVAHDYLADGVTGTGWDGFLGAATGETASALDASIGRSGQLFLQSTGAYWHDPWTPLGPFLYKIVEGDFVATVKVTDYEGTSASPVYYNNCGLLARAPVEEAGDSEDWVALDYFPLYSCGNFVRSADDGTRTENGHNSRAWNLYPWLQIERVGNTFYFRTSSDGVTWTEMSVSPLTRDDLDGVALQVGMYQGTYNTTSGYAAFDEFSVEGPQVVPGMKAYNAIPIDESDDVVRDVVLSWTPYEMAVSHDVYFGTEVDAVTTAGRTEPQGVALATAQDANSYDVGILEFGQTYYWRVDEVGADGTIYPGDVWSFAVEPYSYPIANVTASASSSYNANTGPEKTVDGSGLDENDQHSDELKNMWLSQKNAAEPAWIQYEFDAVYKLDRILVWNSNQGMESILGVGVKDATVEVSTDGNAWMELATVELAQGTGDLLSPQTFEVGGVMAKYVKLTILSNWGGLLKQYGLSEVRFYSVPVTAREPDPADGETDVNPEVTLGWRAGREAASHQVALSADEQAVIDGTAPVATVSDPQYEATLDLDRSYFWKVVEVNDAAAPTSWEGDVWTFSTAQYLVVDDFESYTDDIDNNGTIYQTWSDGWGDQTNGSVVGYSEAPFAEQTLVYDGGQSMPLSYDNTGGAAYSEATRTFESAQNWTLHGIQTLVIYFRGDAGNTASPIYVKINDTKVLYDGGASATAMPVWKQWNIDLASTGANLKSVKSLTLGVGNSGGAGVLYIDEIRLYRLASEIVAPVDPGTAGIVAKYTMDGNLQDSSGRNNNGTTTTEISYDDSFSGHGKAVVLNGTNAYIDLPIGSVISSLSDMTISLYANFSGVSGDWQRIFDFGSGTTAYMFLCPRSTSGGPMRFAIQSATVAEQILSPSDALPTGWHHVAVVFDSAAMTMRLHVDGAVVASGATTVLPKDLGNTTQNWLGRSQYEADAYYGGMLDDVCIYNRAMSEGEIRYLAGDR